MIYTYKGTRLALSRPPEVEDRLGPLPDALECTVSRDTDGMFQLSMTYPVKGENAGVLQVNHWLKADAGGDQGQQYFRIDQVEETLDGTLSVHAGHLSYNALAMVAAPFQAHTSGDYSAVAFLPWYQALRAAVNQVDRSQLGGFQVIGYTDDLGLNPASYTQPVTVKQAVLDAVRGREDVYLDYTTFGFRLWRSPEGAAPAFRVRYGRDLAGYHASVDATDFFTHVLPYYMAGDTLVSHGLEVYPLEGLPQEYAGYRRIQPVDLASYYQGLSVELDQDTLAGVIQRWLSEHPWDPLPDQLSVEALPQEGNSFELGAVGKIYCPTAKRVVTARVVSLTYDVLAGRVTTIGINRRQKDVTDTIAGLAKG